MGRLSSGITSVCFILFYRRIQRTFWIVGCSNFRCVPPPKCGDAPEANATAESPLKVVMPSMGQTATTSLAIATQHLGYKTFHIEEKYVYAHRMMWDVEDHEEFRRAVAGCKVESVALEPPWDSLPHALLTSPKAKFVLTWRPYDEWVVSSGLVARRHLDNGAQGGKHDRWSFIFSEISGSWRLFPWGFLWDHLTGQITEAFREGHVMLGPEQTTLLRYLLMRLVHTFNVKGPFNADGVDNAWDRGNYKAAADEEAYIGHIDEIRRTVPPEQLLVFDPKRHGWADLSLFLGRPAPEGVPFPHPRSRSSWTNDTMYDNRLDVGAACFAIFLVLHVLNYSIVHLWVRTALWLLWRCGLLPTAWFGGPQPWDA